MIVIRLMKFQMGCGRSGSSKGRAVKRRWKMVRSSVICHGD
jgi:hypothetical protein